MRWHLLKIFVNFVKTSVRRKSEENRVLMMPGLTNDFLGKWKSINDFWLDSAHYECGVNIRQEMRVCWVNCSESHHYCAGKYSRDCIHLIDHEFSGLSRDSWDYDEILDMGRYELIFAPSLHPLPHLVWHHLSTLHHWQ